MDLEREKKITCSCSKCGRQESVFLPQIITEKHREKAEDLSLFKWTCPQCGHLLKLLYPCMYLNRSKRILIWYVDELQETQRLEEEITPELKQETVWFTKRFCRTLEEFGEKIRVLEQGLDDRTLELLKITIFARLHVADKTLEHIYFYRKDEIGNLEFTLLYSEGPKGITVNGTMYQEIDTIVKEKIKAQADQFYCIDPDWAGQQIVHMM